MTPTTTHIGSTRLENKVTVIRYGKETSNHPFPPYKKHPESLFHENHFQNSNPNHTG